MFCWLYSSYYPGLRIQLGIGTASPCGIPPLHKIPAANPAARLAIQVDEIIFIICLVSLLALTLFVAYSYTIPDSICRHTNTLQLFIKILDKAKILRESSLKVMKYDDWRIAVKL